MTEFEYEMLKTKAQMKRDLGIDNKPKGPGCIWTIVGILLIIALCKYLF
jgi:hypothetical protein